MSVVIKTFFQDDIRRFTLSRDSEPTFAALRDKIKQLYTFPTDAFILRWKDADGDLVTLASDADLREAVHVGSIDGTLRVTIVNQQQQATPATDATSATPATPFEQPQARGPFQQPPQPHQHPHQHQHHHQHQHRQGGHQQWGQWGQWGNPRCPRQGFGFQQQQPYQQQFQQQQRHQQQQRQEDDKGVAPQQHVGVVCDGCDGAIFGSRFKCAVCPDFDLCAKCESNGLHAHHDLLRIRNPRNPRCGRFNATPTGAQPRPQQQPQQGNTTFTELIGGIHSFLSQAGILGSQCQGRKFGCQQPRAQQQQQQQQQKQQAQQQQRKQADLEEDDPTAEEVPTGEVPPEYTSASTASTASTEQQPPAFTLFEPLFDVFASVDRDAAVAAARADDEAEARDDAQGQAATTATTAGSTATSDQAGSFEAQLQALREMGFENDEVLREVLRRNKGVIARVLNDLLQ